MTSFSMRNILLVTTFFLSQASARALTYNPATYDVEKGCYDAASQTHKRILLSSAQQIHERILSKDFECTEMSDVILEGVGKDGTGLLVHGDFADFKVVGIFGVGGNPRNAGVKDINFRGAKISNMFLDYHVIIGGDARGIVVRGMYLGRYARFDTYETSNNCRSQTGVSPFPLPSYVVKTDTSLAVRAQSSITGEFEYREFSLGSVVCDSN